MCTCSFPAFAKDQEDDDNVAETGEVHPLGAVWLKGHFKSVRLTPVNFKMDRISAWVWIVSVSRMVALGKLTVTKLRQ